MFSCYMFHVWQRYKNKIITHDPKPDKPTHNFWRPTKTGTRQRNRETADTTPHANAVCADTICIKAALHDIFAQKAKKLAF